MKKYTVEEVIVIKTANKYVLVLDEDFDDYSYNVLVFYGIKYSFELNSIRNWVIISQDVIKAGDVVFFVQDVKKYEVVD